MVCPECGFRAGPGSPNCAAQRDALLARDFEQPALFWRFHRMTVDTYCLQYSEGVASAKSLAAHLCGLCIAFEHNNDPEAFRQLQRWLSTNPKIQKPHLPTRRGELTIAHVSGIDDPVEFGKAVESWARSTWNAYHELQRLAREWLSMSARQAR
jgi:hypothetical protein